MSHDFYGYFLLIGGTENKNNYHFCLFPLARTRLFLLGLSKAFFPDFELTGSLKVTLKSRIIHQNNIYSLNYTLF